MTSFQIQDARACQLGEGLLWHPSLNKLFWFDIMARKLLCDDGREWQFDEHVSAAGWLNDDALIIASETGLLQFDLTNGTHTAICPLDAANTGTRSNDGRADPWGGFWIGTMGKNADPGQGAIYRYYRGELRPLYAPISISNAICFTPDGSHAYFADTATSQVMKVALRSGDGWPDGDPVVFLDFRGENLKPDGAVVTANGLFVNAQWGSARVACYDADGSMIQSFELPADNITCPAFGGPARNQLFATSAKQGLNAEQKEAQPDAGKTFVINTGLEGQKEHQVIL